MPRDRIPHDFIIHQLYSSELFQHFVASCFELPRLHELADPLAGLVLNVVNPGNPVLNVGQARGLSTPPDWIFLHKTTIGELPPPLASALARGYDRVPIDVKEVNWENNPEPYWHYYRTRVDGPDISLLRRKPRIP